MNWSAGKVALKTIKASPRNGRGAGTGTGWGLVIFAAPACPTTARTTTYLVIDNILPTAELRSMSFELQKYILSYSFPDLAIKFLFYNFSAANLKFQINQLNEKLNYEYGCNT